MVKGRIEKTALLKYLISASSLPYDSEGQRKRHFFFQNTRREKECIIREYRK